MDYNVFYRDVAAWIGQANQAAMTNGMENPVFWAWVADSCGAITRKYGESRIVIKQMMMLVEWLEEVYEGRKQ